MKSYLINILIFGGILLLYYFDVFALFANQNMSIAVYALVALLFVIGFFVFGNPFGKGNDDEDK